MTIEFKDIPVNMNVVFTTHNKTVFSKTPNPMFASFSVLQRISFVLYEGARYTYDHKNQTVNICAF
jgi:hypothetical protein